MADIKNTIEDLQLLNKLCNGTVLDDAITLLKEQQTIISLQHNALRRSADTVKVLLNTIHGIVLCKDCKYFKQPENIDENGYCTHLKLHNPTYWFCYDGWRKKDA